MRTLLGILFQTLYISFASGSIFLFTSVIAPLKPVISHPATHLPRMSIRLSDFSLPMAALEDDYNVGEMEDEVIPQNVPSRELRPGTVEMQIRIPVLRIPSMKMQASSFQELSHVTPTVQPVAYKEKAETLEAPAAVSNGLKHAHYWIEGKVQLIDGLALASSQDKINVGWAQEGEVKREGKVSIQEGRYSIRVDKLEGEVIAELADSKGFVMGEANIDLEKLMRERGDGNVTIANVNLELAPYNFGFRARTLSVYDTPSSKMPVGSTQVALGKHDVRFQSNERGQVKNEAISAKSSAILYANKGAHRETIVIADFNKEQSLRMFPEKYIKALFDSIDLPKEFRDLGVVWGKVTNRGVPTGGYRVRLNSAP